jgi:hypothetical protein
MERLITRDFIARLPIELVGKVPPNLDGRQAATM